MAKKINAFGVLFKFLMLLHNMYSDLLLSLLLLTVSVRDFSFCGRFGLWPFGFWPFSYIFGYFRRKCDSDDVLDTIWRPFLIFWKYFWCNGKTRIHLQAKNQSGATWLKFSCFNESELSCHDWMSLNQPDMIDQISVAITLLILGRGHKTSCCRLSVLSVFRDYWNIVDPLHIALIFGSKLQW